MAAVAQQQKRRDPPGPSEERFVAQKLRLGASWDAIAAMLGRSTLDVRRAFDPAFKQSGFALPPIASAPPKPTAVLVCGRRVQVAGMSSAEVVVLKALASGETVSTAGLRARVGGAEGEPIGEETLRQLVKRVDKALPEPLRVESFGKDGLVIVARPGAPRPVGRPAAPRSAPSNPFDLKLPPICVALLELLVRAQGRIVDNADLRKASIPISGSRLCLDSLRTRVSHINAELPAGARIVAEYGVGYRLVGGELVPMREGSHG